TGSNGPCVPRRQGRRACRHKTNRGRGVAACRSRRGRAVRRPRRAFFSAALERDDHGEGIAEDTSELGPGDGAGKAVDVQESLEFGHPRIVTSSPRWRKSDFVGKSREKLALTTESYPHDFTKSLYFFDHTKPFNVGFVIKHPNSSLSAEIHERLVRIHHVGEIP